jgi:hypothetical protein
MTWLHLGRLEMRVPELDPRCRSWIVSDRRTGNAVLETFSRVTAEAVNQELYKVETATQWLGRFNAGIRRAS